VTHQGRHPVRSSDPCPEHAGACTLLAWGEPVTAEDREHIDTCPRCSAAVHAQQALSKSTTLLTEAPPTNVRNGLAGAVLAATTRREAQVGRRPWAWRGTAAALTAAGLAGLVWWRGGTPKDDAAPDFAEVDLELLEDLDLAENLDLLEILDALEELDDA